MNEGFMKLNLDEIEALKGALQLLSKKEQKLMESSGKVRLNDLYEKLSSAYDSMELKND